MVFGDWGVEFVCRLIVVKSCEIMRFFGEPRLCNGFVVIMEFDFVVFREWYFCVW